MNEKEIEQKRVERTFMVGFLNARGQGELIQFLKDDERPDFLIENGDKTLGIEVIQLLEGSNSTGDKRVKIEGGWADVISELDRVWKTNGLPKVEVSLIFSNETHVPGKKIESLVERIMKVVKENLPNEDEDKTFENDGTIDGFPEEITNLSILRCKGFKTSNWDYVDGSWGIILESKMIQRCIDKKEMKRSDYIEKCDEVWLLIVANGGKPSGLFNYEPWLFESKFESSFDAVFFFDTSTASFVSLKSQQSQ